MRFRFDDSDPRDYPSLSLSVAFGDVVDLDENPDPSRFTPVDTPDGPPPDSPPDSPPDVPTLEV